VLAAAAAVDAFGLCYDDFVADPFGTVEAAYGYFGLPLSGAAADAMRSVVRADPAGPAAGSPGRGGEGAERCEGSRPARRYTLAEFGLTGEEVDERFAAYPGPRTEQALG
jgi:hypothetical protein